MQPKNNIMQKVRNFGRHPLILAGVTFFLGSIIGLVVLGWLLWPVQYIDTTPEMLRSDIQVDFLRMTVDSYSVNGRGNQARSRFDQLGPRKWDALAALRSESEANPASVDPVRLREFELLIANTTGADPDNTPATTTEEPQIVPGSVLPLLVALGLIIAGASAAVLAANIRRRKKVRILGPASEEDNLSLEAEEERSEQPVEPASSGKTDEGTEPLERFVTTYEIGNDVYEDSFTVNSPGGEFLGECGVGISEPIGVGGQKKVTAFEVWLFDRKPSRTSTVVLMSRYAFQKENLRAALAPRGKPVLAEAGSDFWLETPGLQLRVMVRELEYGKGPLPENSFFEGLSLQMEVWPRPGKIA